MRCKTLRLAAVAVCVVLAVAGGVRANDGEIVVRGTDSVIGIYRDELTDAIHDAIRKGSLWLRDNQARDGSWNPPDRWDDEADSVHFAAGDKRIGSTAVIAMGLMYAGVNTNSPTVSRALGYVARQNRTSHSTYTRGAMGSAFALSDPSGRNRQVSQFVDIQIRWLADVQSNNDWNLWRYSARSGQLRLYDLSCTQFALEAYRAADAAGYQLPPGPLRAAQEQLHKLQNRDGGWGYSADRTAEERPQQKESKLSMTGATVGGLAFLDAALSRAREGVSRRDPAIDSGLKALARLYAEESRTVRRGGRHRGQEQWNPPNNPYTAYSIERAGILTGTRYLDGHDWYREMAQVFLDEQDDDGSWPSYHGDHHKALGTGFTLLFLGKGLAPTIVGRLDWGPPSQTTPWDMRNLTEAVTRELGTHLNWIGLPLEADAEEFLKVPLIYITGDEDPYNALIAHREKFVRYLNAGGTLLGTGVQNSREFEEGYMRFVKEIQPGAEFEQLALNHMIYTRLHRIRRPYGLSATQSAQGGRPVALLIRNPFTVPLSTMRHRNTRQAVELGTNIIVALTQLDARPNLLQDVMK